MALLLCGSLNETKVITVVTANLLKETIRTSLYSPLEKSGVRPHFI